MNFIIENIDQGYRHLVQQIKEDNMTDRKSKKLKHDKINYESDRCYMSLKQFEGHTLIMYNSTRLLIPTNARRRIANELHKAHSGLTKMMKTATQLYYWPNMRTLLESVVQKCTTCQKDRPTQARMKMKETLPSDALIPMNELGSDCLLYTSPSPRDS